MPRWKIEGDPNSLLDALKTAEKAMDQHARNGGRAWDGFNDRTTRGVQRTTSAIESMYSRTTRSITNAVKSIPVPGLGPAGGLLGAAGATAAIGKAINDYIELANATKQLGLESGATAERMSTLIGVGAQLGVSTEAISSGFRTLKEAMNTEDGQRQLAALGITVKDLEGNMRPVIDVYDDFRARISGAKMDAGTLQVVQELLGRDYREQLPLLQMTADEYARMALRVAELGEVMDQAGIQKAQEWQLTMKQGEIVSRQFGEVALPILMDAVRGLGVVFDVVGTIARNAWDAITGQGGSLNPFDAVDAAMRRAQDSARRIQDSARAIVGAGTSTSGGDSLGFASRAAQQAADRAAADAMRDRIEAIRELAAAEERRLRKALDGFERERDAAIDAIREQQDARERAHESAIDAIEDEVRAAEQAFELRDRARSDEIAGLRDQVRATSELLELEKDRQDVAEAEKDLAHERNVVVTRDGFRSALDYFRAVSDQNRRVRDSEERLSDAKKKLAQDEARARIEARITALEREGELEKRALDDYKTAAEERIRKIREQMAVEKEQSDTRVAALQKEIEKERERVQTAIANLQEETRVTVNELQKRLTEHQRVAGAVAAAWSAAAAAAASAASAGAAGGASGGVAVNTGQGTGAAIDPGITGDRSGAYLAMPEQFQQLAMRYLGRRFDESFNNPAFPNTTEFAAHYLDWIGKPISQITHWLRNSPEGQAFELSQRATGGGAGGPKHDFPHSMTFGEPVVMIGRSGKNYGEIAATGSEDVTFHGVGGGGRRGGSGVGGLTLNMPITINAGRHEAHRRIDEAFDDLEAELAAENSYGFRGGSG